jgi:hypothetical protein
MADLFAQQFYYYVGQCITAWAKVEEHLFEIVLTSLGASRQRTAIIYYRTPTIDTRLQLVDELIRTVLPQRTRKDGGHDHPDVIIWDKLRKEIGEHFPTRNRIAHHPVAEKKLINITIPGATPMPAAASDLLTFSWYESYVSDAERLRGKHEDAKPLGVPDLANHRVAIEGLITKLELFRTHVLVQHVK